MRFLLDNCMPKAAGAMLSAFDRANVVETISDHFESNIKDSDWIARVSKWDVRPFIVSADGRILRNAVERHILRESGVTFFLMAPN